MRIVVVLLSMIILSSCTKNEKVKINMMAYPETKKVDVVDDYFGTKIEDPYRWLENDTSKETAEWVKAQNAVTKNYLSQIPFKDDIKKRLTEIWNYEKISAPFRKGDYYFYYKNDGLQNQAVLYYKNGLDGKDEVFLDPNKLSDDGTVALSGIYFSHDNKYAAYIISKSGSDWNEIFVKEIASGKLLDDHIEWVKF